MIANLTSERSVRNSMVIRTIFLLRKHKMLVTWLTSGDDFRRDSRFNSIPTGDMVERE